MTGSVAPEYAKFVVAARKAERLTSAPERLAAGQTAESLVVDAKEASALLRVAARRAVGLYRPTKRTEVVWVEGERELAVGIAGVGIDFSDGHLVVMIPIRCDQIGQDRVEVHFAVGSPEQPAGVFASTLRTPIGPRLVVEAWGDALVAFAWQCVLGLVAGLAGAVGKDERGNVLVPAEMNVTRNGLQIVPMARHRFSGSSGLLTKTGRR